MSKCSGGGGEVDTPACRGDQLGMVYLDYNATTRVAPESVQAMLPFLTEDWGNPSSAYGFGTRASRAIQEARQKVAALLGADPGEVIFTSCGTESTNAALASALALRPDRRHLVTTAVEHPATLSFCRMCERRGTEVTRLPVSGEGLLDLERLEAALRPDTAIVSVMWANNETGVLFPIQEIAALCRHRGILFHTDAIQVPGKLSIRVEDLGIDFLSLSGHKFHAPKGIGLLYVRRGAPFESYVVGGHQERDRRAGTENVAGIVALGGAAELAKARLHEWELRVRPLRDRLEQGVLRLVPGSRRNGSADYRLANTANIAFDGVDAEAAVVALDAVGICVSTGSACAAGSVGPSHVLTAMGLSPRQARGSLRFSLGMDSTDSDVDAVLSQLPRIIDELRAEMPAGT